MRPVTNWPILKYRKSNKIPEGHVAENVSEYILSDTYSLPCCISREERVIIRNGCGGVRSVRSQSCVMKVWEDLLPLPHNAKQRSCTPHVGRVTANQKTSYAGGHPYLNPQRTHSMQVLQRALCHILMSQWCIVQGLCRSPSLTLMCNSIVSVQ